MGRGNLSDRPSRLRVHAAMFTVALLFSLNYIISKLGMREFSPLSFAWLRCAASAVILNFVLLPRDATARLSRDDAWRIAGFGVLGVALNQAFFLGGLALTSAHVAAILVTILPISVLGIAIAMRRERATPAKIGGILLAAAGAILVIGGERIEGTTRSVLGAILIVAAGFLYALYLVLSKPLMARLSAMRVVARMFAAATIFMLPVSAWSLAHEQWSAISARAWLALAAVVLGPTISAYLLNAWALRHTESSVVAAYTYVQPVLATLLAAAFLGETLHAIVAVAAVMIFAGVRLASNR